MATQKFSVSPSVGLMNPRSRWLSKSSQASRGRDKLILLVLVAGFYSIWSRASIQDLQSDPLAAKAVRIATVLLAFLLASRVFILPRMKRLFFCKTVLPIVLFFCVCSLSVSVSEWPLLTAYKTFEILVIIMLIVEGVADERSNPESLLRWMIGLITVQTCVVWIEGMMFPGLAWSTPSQSKTVLVRMLHGIFPIVNPNTLGFFGGTILVYGIGCLLVRKRRRLVSYVLPALGASTIGASYSRTSVLAASAAIVLMLLAFRKLGVTIALLALLSVALVIGPVRTNIVKHVDRGRDSSNLEEFAGSRLNLWQECMAYFPSWMLLGKGYGVAFRAERTVSSTNAHSSILELYAGTGLVGVCMWLYMMGNIWFRLVLSWRYRLDSLDYRHILYLALMAFLSISSLGNTRGVYLDYPVLLFAAIAVYAEKTSHCLSRPAYDQQWTIGRKETSRIG